MSMLWLYFKNAGCNKLLYVCSWLSVLPNESFPTEELRAVYWWVVTISSGTCSLQKNRESHVKFDFKSLLKGPYKWQGSMKGKKNQTGRAPLLLLQKFLFLETMGCFKRGKWSAYPHVCTNHWASEFLCGRRRYSVSGPQFLCALREKLVSCFSVRMLHSAALLSWLVLCLFLG